VGNYCYVAVCSAALGASATTEGGKGRGHIVAAARLQLVKCKSMATWKNSLSPLSLSLRFNGHFLGGPGLAGTRMSPFWILLEPRVMEVVVTTGAIRRAKLQSKCHHHKSTPNFFTGQMPLLSPNQQCQSTERKIQYCVQYGKECRVVYNQADYFIDHTIVVLWKENSNLLYFVSKFHTYYKSVLDQFDINKFRYIMPLCPHLTRRLATTNISHISISGEPCKNFLYI